MKKMKKNIFKIMGVSITAFIGGLLGAYAGSSGTSKNWRRMGIPILVTTVAFITLKNPLTLILLGLFIPFIIGYGIPSWNDSGSMLGKFYYNLIKTLNAKKFLGLSEKEIQTYSNYPTRGTIGLIINLFLVCIPIIKGNWLVYALCSLGIVLTYALISWRDLGVYQALGKSLLWSETFTYFLITLFITITIFF